MTANKGIGMTEAEWNQIALHNAENLKKETEKRKEKLQQQREIMRSELEKQVAKRKQDAADKRQ